MKRLGAVERAREAFLSRGSFLEQGRQREQGRQGKQREKMFAKSQMIQSYYPIEIFFKSLHPYFYGYNEGVEVK
ncbi:MAG: hypothetical protein D6728_01280 [Cyanobacteria bacterium J055]|nr:MAG: hypothetical protein D6728_01280 [Cyanobacteria bacterium J055]